MNQRLWILCSLLILALGTSAQSPNPSPQSRPSAQEEHSSEDIAVRLERQAWEAAKAKDYGKYVRLLAEDFLDVEPVGVITKSEEENGIVRLTVEDYKWEGLRVVHLTPDVTLLVYKATQKANFSGQPVPTPTWVSSLWVKRNGKWLNALVQETKAE